MLRKRRIKCGMEKPSCRACIQSRRTCDGYAAQSRAARGTASHSSSPESAGAGSQSLPFRTTGSVRDQELIHYFCLYGAPAISGFLPCSFWTRTVLQASHHEPVVRQMLVALSSLHMDYVSGESSGIVTASMDTMQQYGKGIFMLRERMTKSSSRDRGIALLCTAISHCFESIVGNSESATRQLQCGLALLSSPRDTFDDLEDYDIVASLFGRLDLQAVFFDDSQVPSLTLTTEEERRDGFIGSEEVAFGSLREAQEKLVKIQNWTMHLLIRHAGYRDKASAQIPADILEEKKQLARQYRLWDRRFGRLCFRDMTSNRGAGSNRSLLLLIQHRACEMQLLSRLPSDETVFGTCPNHGGREIVRIAEKLLRTTPTGLEEARTEAAASSFPSSSDRQFSTESGVLAPLMLLIVRCADPWVVQRAVGLLSASRRQEGLFDSSDLLLVTQSLNDIKSSRQSQSVADPTPTSLEHWTVDVIDGETVVPEMILLNLPPTLVSPPRSPM